jgi:outer membrane protein assembly factor BamD (BamD/ComL family)/ABC-type branched-subunit amino acid transport system substrate-binding protein
MKKYALLGIIVLLSCAGIRPRALDEYASQKESEKAAVIYERGNEFFKAREYRSAIEELSEIIDKYEKSTAYEPALYMVAVSHFKLHEYKKATSYGEKFLKEFPNSQYLLNTISLVGESYYKLVKDYEASQYLLEFYTATEDSVARKKAFERIANTLPKLSISQLEKLHRQYMNDPVDEHILYTLAQIEAREGKKKEAERDFDLLMRRFPNTKYTAEVSDYKKFIQLGEASGRAGILLPLTGKFAHIGQKLYEVVRLFENKKRLPFSLHVRDTNSDPIDAMLSAAKLVDDLEVDFIIAPISISTGEAFGVCGVAYGKGVPVVLPMTSESKFEEVPNVYTSGHTTHKQARIIANFSMYDVTLQRFAILYPEIPRYEEAAKAFAQEISKTNREIVAMVSFHPDSITLRWELKTIEEKNPDAIFLPMDMSMIINTAPQIAYYGMQRVKLLGIETFMDEKVTRLGEKYVEGALFAAPAPIDSLTLQEMLKDGLKEDDMVSKFYFILWRLQDLKGYNRSALATQLADILKQQEVFYIYKIDNGEFVKITELAQ